MSRTKGKKKSNGGTAGEPATKKGAARAPKVSWAGRVPQLKPGK